MEVDISEADHAQGGGGGGGGVCRFLWCVSPEPPRACWCSHRSWQHTRRMPLLYLFLPSSPRAAIIVAAQAVMAGSCRLRWQGAWRACPDAPTILLKPGKKAQTVLHREREERKKEEGEQKKKKKKKKKKHNTKQNKAEKLIEECIQVPREDSTTNCKRISHREQDLDYYILLPILPLPLPPVWHWTGTAMGRELLLYTTFINGVRIPCTLPLLWHRTGYRIGNGELIDAMQRDGLNDAYQGCAMVGLRGAMRRRPQPHPGGTGQPRVCHSSPWASPWCAMASLRSSAQPHVGGTGQHPGCHSPPWHGRLGRSGSRHSTCAASESFDVPYALCLPSAGRLRVSVVREGHSCRERQRLCMGDCTGTPEPPAPDNNLGDLSFSKLRLTFGKSSAASLESPLPSFPDSTVLSASGGLFCFSFFPRKQFSETWGGLLIWWWFFCCLIGQVEIKGSKGKPSTLVTKDEQYSKVSHQRGTVL